MYIEKIWENPVQIKSNIYYVRIRERKRQRLSLSLPTVEPHFLLEMDTLMLQTIFLWVKLIS